jgi:2-polyprenyl-6-methoxyphenol hydroxylase-like FAD-dependent oxidoreductase
MVARSAPVAAANTPPASFDVLIVGGGLSGSIAAAVLARAGYQVGLIDRFLLFPPQFRVEKVNGPTIDALKRFGLFDRVASASTFFDRVINVRRGQVLDETRAPHYGIMYHDLVQAVRAQLPAGVDLRIDRVVDVETGADRQQVTLASGDRLEARLLILATGASNMLAETLGIRRRVVSEKHSITFGFSIAPPAGGAFDFPSLTYYGEAISDRVDYLTLFPIGKVMRANLFTFRDDTDPWVGRFVREPKATLLETLPGLTRFVGDFQMASRVDSWLMNLCQTENCQQDGVVIIGDAFQTSCPASGLGCARLVSDVERLCTVHIPRWMNSEGMGASKIRAYYDDRAKQSYDHLALKSSRYRRALTVDTGLRGAMRRQREFLPRRLIGALRPD